MEIENLTLEEAKKIIEIIAETRKLKTDGEEENFHAKNDNYTILIDIFPVKYTIKFSANGNNINTKPLIEWYIKNYAASAAPDHR